MSDVFVNGEPARTLRDFFLAHLVEKVTNNKCECCGETHWTILATGDSPDDYSYLPHGPQTWANDKVWPMMSVTCRNCSHVRLFAAQPIIDKWKTAKAERGEE